MIHFRRILRTKDIELYEFYNLRSKFYCFCIIVDTHRPSTVNDYPHLKDKISDDDEIINNPNLIKAILFFKDEPKEKIESEIESLLDSLLLYLNYDWTSEKIIIKEKPQNKLSEQEVDNFYYDYVSDYLVKNYDFTKQSLNKLDNPTFAFLTQEKEWNKEMEKKYKIKFEE